MMNSFKIVSKHILVSIIPLDYGDEDNPKNKKKRSPPLKQSKSYRSQNSRTYRHQNNAAASAQDLTVASKRGDKG